MKFLNMWGECQVGSKNENKIDKVKKEIFQFKGGGAAKKFENSKFFVTFPYETLC